MICQLWIKSVQVLKATANHLKIPFKMQHLTKDWAKWNKYPKMEQRKWPHKLIKRYSQRMKQLSKDLPWKMSSKNNKALKYLNSNKKWWLKTDKKSKSYKSKYNHSFRSWLSQTKGKTNLKKWSQKGRISLLNLKIIKNKIKDKWAPWINWYKSMKKIWKNLNKPSKITTI